MNSHNRRSIAILVGLATTCSMLCLLYFPAEAGRSSAATHGKASIQSPIAPSTSQPSDSTRQGSAEPRQPQQDERLTPGQATGKLFKFILIVSILLALVMWLTTKLAGCLYRSREKLSATRGRTITFIAIAVIVPLSLNIYFGAESQIIHGWEPRVGAIKEYNYWASYFFDPPANRYSVNVWGQVTDLRLERAGIESFAQLPGIERLTSLTTLEIVENPLSGSPDLSNYTNLKELRLQRTTLQALSGLDRLPDLEVLDLSYSQLAQFEPTPVSGVTDLSALRKAPNLNSLNLTGWDLSRVTGFQYLSRIKTLDLSHCASVDLRIVEHMPQLSVLTLDHSDVTDLSPLALSNSPNVRQLEGFVSGPRQESTVRARAMRSSNDQFACRTEHRIST